MTLASLRLVSIPDGWHLEAVVIANACTDGTIEAASQWDGPFPLSVIVEETPGLSYARNRALQHAQGRGSELVIWNDDDVEFSPSYLLAYQAACEVHPRTKVFGGRILPKFASPSPSDLQLMVDTIGLHPFSCLDLGDDAMAVSPGRGLPFGANLAVRIDSTNSDLRFDPRLGVTPTRKVGFEETVYVKTILQDDNWQYVPKAQVFHLLPVKRQSREAVRQFYRSIGQYEGMSAAREMPNMPMLFGRPRWTWRSGIAARLQLLVSKVLGNHQYVLQQELQIEKIEGYREAFGSEDTPNIAQLIR